MKFKEENINKKDIEMKLVNVGDYVKMDYLQQCLKKHLDFDTKKFVLTKLSGIYESRKMFLEAGRLIRIAADINTTFDNKVNDFLKSSELFVKAGSFDESDVSIAKAIAIANDRQKVFIKIKMKDFYKAQALEFLRRDKRKHALETYEKLLTFDLDYLEKKDVQTNLLSLYKQLGQIDDYFSLNRSMNSHLSR